MVVGKRCFDEDSDHGDDDNSEARRVRTAINRFFYLMGVFVVSDVIPLLKWFDFQGHRGAMKATPKELDSLLVKWIKEDRRRRSLAEVEGWNEDFMDVMLSITEDGEMSGYDSDTIIKATCMALILGGTDATSVNPARAIALVVTSPHVLKKAQEELDIHVGKDRNVDESDIKNLISTSKPSPRRPYASPRTIQPLCPLRPCKIARSTAIMSLLAHKSWSTFGSYTRSHECGRTHANFDPRGSSQNMRVWSPGASTLSTFHLGRAGDRARGSQALSKSSIWCSHV
ncbi:hypothetical protein AAC387_Pa04g2221 [Persea americana]